MALFGALLLVFTNFIRPQEFIPALESIHIVNLAALIAAIGIILDIVQGKLKSFGTPQLPFLGAFLLWCTFCTIVKVGASPLTLMLGKLGYSVIVMILITYATSSFDRLRAMALMLVCVAMMLASFGVREGASSLECIALEKDEHGSVGDMSDGSPVGGMDCEGITDCVKKTKDFETDFVCERMGVFGTFSVDHGRVRWRGTLGDPNELALFIGASLSFALAMHASGKGGMRHLLLFTVLGMATVCVVETASRGGQLVLAAVFGTYFVRRYGIKGVVLAAFFAAPVIALGGRDTEGAESSALERIGALYDGMDFFRSSPIFGLGWGQFTENYFITAHNSYLLSAAELGFPGMVLWSLLVYSSMKIPFVVGTNPPPGMDPRIVPYAFALLTAFAGILVGIFFLSFCYSTMLYTYLGLAGGLYFCVKRSAPSFKVTVSGMEIGAVAGVDAMLLSALFVYTRIKGAP